MQVEIKLDQAVIDQIGDAAQQAADAWANRKKAQDAAGQAAQDTAAALQHQQAASQSADAAAAAEAQAKQHAARSVGMGLTACKVGNMIRIKAVDDAGRPTAWEPAQQGIQWDTIMDADAPTDVQGITFTELPDYTHIRVFFWGVKKADGGNIVCRPYINDRHVGFIRADKGTKWAVDVLDYNGWNYDEYNCKMVPSGNDYVQKSGLWGAEPTKNSPCHKLHIAFDTLLTGGHIIITGGK